MVVLVKVDQVQHFHCEYSILINISPVVLFPTKRLEAGWPSIIIRIILTMEGLSKILDKAKKLQWLNGFEVGKSFQLIYLIYFMQMAPWFLCGKQKSGLLINMLKSVNHSVNECKSGRTGKCIGIRTYPPTYPGVPLGAKYKLELVWSGTIEKFEKNLASWKLQYLSMRGRLT